MDEKKNVLVVHIDNSEYRYEEALNIVEYIEDICGKEYNILVEFNGVKIDCVSDTTKVIRIDGKYYSESELIEIINKYKKSNQENNDSNDNNINNN